MNPVEDQAVYLAVVNHEEQYSVWLADRPLPDGWQAAGAQGTRDECLVNTPDPMHPPTQTPRS